MKVVHRVSPFIRKFSGPGDNEIVCFRFWQAIVASGCPGECAYCFLQTQYPYRKGMYELKGTLFKNLPQIEDEARAWLFQPRPAGMIIGENQDGLAFESPYKRLLGITPLEILIPLFQDFNPSGHTLIVLSKFTNTRYAEAFGPTKHVVFSWSLSLPSISERYEKKVASLDARLSKADEMRQKGYRVRLRLDALAPVEGWEEDLQRVIARINEVQPEMLTIGALRATNVSTLKRAAEKNGRDSSIFDHIDAKDPSGFKYRTGEDFHVRAFRSIKDNLHKDTRLGLCKEDQSIWEAIDVSWDGCHCLHGADDLIVLERREMWEGLD